MHLRTFTKKIYSVINYSKYLPVASLVMNTRRKKQLLLELKDGSKFQITIRPYNKMI